MTRPSRRELESAIEEIKAGESPTSDDVALDEDVKAIILKLLRHKYGLEGPADGDPVDQLTDDERERLDDWMAERRAEADVDADTAADGDDIHA